MILEKVKPNIIKKKHRGPIKNALIIKSKVYTST